MPPSPLPDADLEGDLTVTVLESVGIERHSMKVTGSIDFVEPTSSTPSHHAGPIIRWNHDFFFTVKPGDGYVHISLCEVDDENDGCCGRVEAARPIAHAHLNLLSLLCEDKLVREGAMEVALPLELVDKVPEIPRDAPSGAERTRKVADGSTADSAGSGDHTIDISDLLRPTQTKDADTQPLATPRRGPFEDFKTALTPHRPAAQSAAADTQGSAASPSSSTASLYLVQQQQQRLSSLSPTRPGSTAASRPQSQLLAQRPTTSDASTASATPPPPSNHPAALFASKSPQAAPAPAAQTRSPAVVAPTPMKRASALALLSPGSEPLTLPATSTPVVYLDVPELVRLRVQWSPRWAEAMCRDMMQMVSGGRGWRKAEANKWLTVCGLPSPCDYLWPRLANGHCRYKYADEQDNHGYGTSAQDAARERAATSSTQGAGTKPVDSSKSVEHVEMAVLSDQLPAPAAMPRAGAAGKRVRVKAKDKAAEPDFVAPLQVLSFLMTFSIREVSRMHKCCASKLGGNRVEPRACLTPADLLAARRALAGPAASPAPAVSTAGLQNNALGRTGLLGPGTPSRSLMTPPGTLRLGGTGTLPSIVEDDSGRLSGSKLQGRSSGSINPHYNSRPGSVMTTPPRKGVLGLRR